MVSYPDELNPALLERIPLDARVVLDVGCGTGALGAEYKRRNPRARVLGIEIDPASVEVARGRLDGVALADVEVEPFPFDVGCVDCIIYGDSLEHFRDPWAVLAAHVQRLSADGMVLICMPNAEHWSFAERLLRGTFDYEPQGLFDQTHLRWFTRRTMRQAIEGAGLRPLDVAGRVFDQEGANAFATAAAPMLAALGVERGAYLHRATSLQYVWRARKTAVDRLTVVSTMAPPVGGVSHVRVLEPLGAIATDPAITSAVADTFALDSLPFDAPKICILHRPIIIGVEGLTPVRKLIALGYVVVCEFDDHPDYLADHHGRDIQTFRAVHAVQTSTEPLASILRLHNPEVAVFPNAISRLREPRNFESGHNLTLFFGALNREGDWSPFIDVLNAVVRLVGNRLSFEVVHDRGFFDALETRHKRYTPLCDYATYMELLARSEISFMPLLDTPFNRCKSDLKFLEASSARVLSLASRTVYARSIEDGTTGLLFATPDDLKAKLTRIVNGPSYGREIADAARRHVADERMLAYQTTSRIAWYRSLWGRRAELNVSLGSRMPQAMPLKLHDTS